MSFASIGFLLFCVPLLLVYWKLSSKYQNYLLLIASYGFVSFANPWFAVSLALTTLVTYVCIRFIDAGRFRLPFFLLSLFFLFGQLFVYKYLGLFGMHTLFILIPIGLSFYTFQAASYLIDVYTRKSTLEKNIIEYALFLSFFPTLTAGPIERGHNLILQFKRTHTFEYARVVSGLELFTFGLFKKLVIADNLGTIVDKVFASLELYRGLSLVIAVVFFSWQLYYDFSGYSDMARGIARLFGFELVVNFKTPYCATSVQDFWRRWHISLSTWFKDYVYFPLGGNRSGFLRSLINVVIVFTLCGLWHGAALPFVLWGMMHGALIAIERVFAKVTQKRVRIPNVLAIFLTYSVITLSWILFRSPTLADALYILRNSFIGVSNFIRPQYIYATFSQLFQTNVLEISIVCGVFILGILIEYVSNKYEQTNIVLKLPVFLRFFIYTTAIVMIILLRQATIQNFIYVQF